KTGARLASELAVGRPQLPPHCRPVPLVRLGRLRPTLGSALQAARVRPVHRRAALGRSFAAAGTAGAIVGASETAAAASRTPKPTLGFQVPWPEAVCLRTVATW